MHPFPEEKKVRHYLDSNFTNRPELVTPDPALGGNKEDAARGKTTTFQGTGPKTTDGNCPHKPCSL